MIIVYAGCNEVIVCDKKNEAETVRLYFTEGKRDLDEYDRSECNQSAVVHIESQLSCDIEQG